MFVCAAEIGLGTRLGRSFTPYNSWCSWCSCQAQTGWITIYCTSKCTINAGVAPVAPYVHTKLTDSQHATRLYSRVATACVNPNPCRARSDLVDEDPSEAAKEPADPEGVTTGWKVCEGYSAVVGLLEPMDSDVLRMISSKLLKMCCFLL